VISPDVDSPNPKSTYVGCFKFRAVNEYTKDSLIRKQLYFSSPTELNDPFDCQVDIIQSITEAIRNTSGKQKSQLEKLLNEDGVFATLSSVLAQSGICSFSENLLDPVMWSHYADEHRGIGLYYEIPTSFVLNEGMGMSPVDYGNSPLSEWFETCAISFDTDFLFEVMKKASTVKGSFWRHESELRLIRFESGGVEIDPAFLKEVSFGLRTPESDKKLIRKIVESNYPLCGFVQIKRGRSDFDLLAIDI